MKLAVILGLVAVAIASQHWEQRPENINERSFRAGKHYQFKFDGQISTGLPHPSSQLSLTRIQSIVSLVFENDRTCLFKMQQTRMGSAHREISEPREVQPFGLFEESEMTPEQKEQLSLPVRFRYEQGIISSVEFEREEPAWSANIKRSVLNMLQINMGKQMRTDEKEMSRLPESEQLSQQTPSPSDYFTTQEKTLEGDCETAYTLVPTGEKKIRVSKSINFEKCIRRVDMRYNMNMGEECPSCEKKYIVEEKNTESTTVFKFELSYESSPLSFLIREAELKSTYVHAPISKEHPISSTFVANKLTLIKVTEDRNAVSSPAQPKPAESLLYSTEWEEKMQRFRMTGEESLLRESPYTWMTQKMEIATRLFSELRREMSTLEKQDELPEEYTPEVSRILAHLVKIMRVCTKSELSQLLRECEKSAPCKAIFFDACAIAGTKNTIEYLSEKIVEKHVSPLKAARLVKMLSAVPMPSEPIVDVLIRLTKEEVCQRNPVLKQSTWLTVGSLLNNLCASEELSEQKKSTQSMEPLCRRETKEKYVQIFERLYESAESRAEKILALKTMANAGFDLVVFPLEKLIRDERVEKTIRMQAIDGLRQVRKLMPRKIQALLMPLYKNTREQPEIRVAAFHQIMQTLPERVVLDQIVAQLNKEPSTPVAAFVYSTLVQYTKTSIPCEKDMARDIEQSLRLTRYQPRPYTEGAFARGSFYNERLFAGAAVNWAALFSKDSVLPKELSASLDTLFAGSWTKYFGQIGIYQQNVDQWLFRLVEQLENGEMPEYSMDDVIVRGKRAASPKPAELLKQLMAKAGIVQRRSSLDKDAHAIIYLRYKDMDFAFLPLEERTLTHFYKQVTRNNKIHTAEIERILAQGYDFELHAATFGYEKTRVIPTTLGMPLEVTIKMPTVLSIKGKLTAELEGSMEGARVHLRAQPKLASTHVISMEVRCPVTSNGVAMTHSALVSLPIDAELSLNWARKLDAKLTIRAPEQRRERKLVSLSSRPITYVRYESEPKKCAAVFEKTVFVPRSEQAQFTRVELDSVYGEQLVGVRFGVRGNIHRHPMSPTMAARFPVNVFVPALNGENHVEVTMEKMEDGPREFVIRMNFDAFEKQEKISEQPEEFERFYEKDNEEHFEVEDSEYVKEDDKERRVEFGSYVKNWKNEQRPAYKGRMHIKAEAVGGRVEKRAQMEIVALCSAEFSYCSWKVDARRSPMLESERSEWTLTATLQTLLPRFVRSFDELREQKHREISALVKAIWGAEQKNTINARIQLAQDKHQQKWQALTLKKENIEENYERLVLASRLNQIKMVADYKIHPETLVHFGRLNALLKAWKPMCEVQPRSLELAYKPEGRLLVSFTVEPQTWRYANLSVVSPSEQMTIENIRLPFRPVFVSIEKRQNSFPRSVSELTRKIVKSPVCEVSSSKISTFDDVIYRAPLTTCYSILAKDCSERPQFAILMKKINKNSEEKKMKIVTEQKIHEIEMKQNGDFVVKVDGKKINERDYEMYKMEKLGEKIIFETEDFKIRFDGYNAEIEIAEYYKEKQCGVCGHFDGETEGEFRRADNKHTEDLEEFHRSFLSKDEECEMEEEKLKEKKNYKKYEPEEFNSSEEEEKNEEFYEKEQNEWEFFENKNYKKNEKKNFKNEDEEETVEPVKKTFIIEHSSRICFSQKPVLQCPRDSFAKEAKEMKIKFSCMERSEPEARRMLRESRNIDILNIEEMPVSFVDTIRVPKTCTVY